MNNEFFELMQRYGIHSCPNRYKYYFKQFFRGYSFEKKRVLDIGGGTGQLSLFAAANGASDVVCLEPEDSGSTSGVTTIFNKLISEGGYKQINILPIIFQDYVSRDVGNFDIIVSNASINHLDEDAVIDLQTNTKSVARYKALVRQMYDILIPSGVIIIADVTRRNLFGDLGIKSPICKSIEWQKHQNPRFWRELFEEAGFKLVRKEYQTFNVFKDFGRYILGNPVFSYIYGSLFILEFRKE